MNNTVRNSRRLWLELLRRLDRDQKGAVSIETVLIIAAVALPILIFILKFGWPKIQNFFNKGMDDLGTGVNNVTNNTGSGTTGS